MTNHKLLMPPYFAIQAVHQPTLATLTTLAHIASTLTIKYHGATLDQLMFLASTIFTIQQGGKEDEEHIEAVARDHWKDMHCNK